MHERPMTRAVGIPAQARPTASPGQRRGPDRAIGFCRTQPPRHAMLASAMVLVSTAITYPHPWQARRSARRQSDQLGSPWPNFLPYSSQT
jgi:hypothetical protein